MSHSHIAKEKSKNIKQELEALQESKVLVEAAKAELLNHNPIIHNESDYEHDNENLEAAKEAPPEPEVETYIKRPEDVKRSKKPIFVQESDAPASPVGQLISLQSQFLGLWMESCVNMSNLFLNPSILQLKDKAKSSS